MHVYELNRLWAEELYKMLSCNKFQRILKKELGIDAEGLGRYVTWR
jgi:hypothetical protein